MLKKILPQLERLRELKPQQDAEIFLGKKGLRSAYERLLSIHGNEEDYFFFYMHEEEYAEESDLFYNSIQSLLRKVSPRGISNERGRKSRFIRKAKYIDCRFADFPIPGNIEVCGDKILLVSWERPIIAVLISSQSIAGNFRRYFNSVWKVAKK
jgi:hypothetical protein